MIVCDKCGHENADGRQFCEACDEYLVWRGKSVSATMATLTPAEVTVKPGVEATAQLRVFNRGSIVDKFTFDLPSELGAWASVEPQALNLYPNTNGDATIRFHPPRSPEVAAGPVGFTIRVRSAVNPGATAEAVGTVTVEPFADIAARLVPATSRSTGPAEHEIKIGNSGNAAAEIAVSVTNPDDQLDFQLASETVRLDAGEGTSVKLVVGPRNVEQMAQGVPQPFRVTLTAPGTADVTLDGAYQRISLVQLEGSLDPQASRASGTAEHWVTINNGGNTPASVTVTASDAQGLLAFQLTPSNLTVEGGGSVRARLWVGLRRRDGSGDRGGVAIPFQVVARAGESSPVELDGSYTPLAARMSATLEPRISRAQGGAQHTLIVVNNGNRQGNVSIVASDADEVLSISVSPSRLTLDPGRGGRATVWVSLRDRWAPSGGDPRPFEVQLSADGAAPIKVSGAFVPLFAQLTGTLDPPSTEGIGTGEQWVVVTNTGNMRTEATLAATDPVRAFNFELSPNWVQLEPGQTARVRLRLTPRRQPRGSAEPRSFQVDIQSETAAPITVPGTRVQVPPPHGDRRWIPITLRVVAALAVLLIGIIVALNATMVNLSVVDGRTTYQIPFVSMAAVALGILGFLIFVPRRGWFIAVGVLGAGAIGVWLLSTMQVLKL